MIAYRTDRPILRSVTTVLVLANMTVYVILQLGGDQLLLELAQTSQFFFAGWYWQVFTALFVHFDISHILFNMIALFYFGRLDELSYSTSQYLTIYFGAGLLGNIV